MGMRRNFARTVKKIERQWDEILEETGMEVVEETHKDLIKGTVEKLGIFFRNMKKTRKELNRNWEGNEIGICLFPVPSQMLPTPPS